MSIPSRVMERVLQLPPARTRAVRVRRRIPVRTRDGVVLRTDHWEPRLRGAPTILIRTPYGRGGAIGLVSGRLLAERGFHVVMQSCRGTFDSGGEWNPLRYEREDGLDTVAWIERQPWFEGSLFTFGPSYLGFTQWAIASETGPVLKGMLTAVTASAFRDPTYAGGAYALDTILNWATLTSNQGGSTLSFAYKQYRSQSRLRRAWTHLPLSEVDALAAGREVTFFQEWLTHCEPDDPYWTPRGNPDVARVQAPVCMVGGWYDIFLPWQLRDYATLRAAGAAPRLVIGPWTHASPELLGASMREAIAWFRASMDGGASGGVRVHVGGIDEWRELPTWPPSTRSRSWFLQPEGGLAPQPPAASPPDRFRFDPSDPTPSPGGPLLTRQAGRVDNRAVEARPDTLVYTSAVLSADVEAIGPVAATVRVRADGEHFDVFVRVCDVDPDGRSENISDGLVRVAPGQFPPDADGVRAVEVELWPMGYVFRRGHRIRVQLAGGAHPRYARNCGTGDPIGTAIELRPVAQEIWHDPEHPSELRLPA
ncbi:CocE/NonD family hydrolase [Rugosimonospora acidiphila]|uniref:CocE/NonD family hydrolase n=1 Tax=Rugosimonospora acidiphila TaxID=556531 RepID=A0ABP9SEQ7_9ACTN